MPSFLLGVSLSSGSGFLVGPSRTRMGNRPAFFVPRLFPVRKQTQAGVCTMKRNRNTFQRREPEHGKHTYLPLTKDSIERNEEAVRADPVYGVQGKEIKSYLTKYPKNNDRDIVIHKILLIDFTNSTNLRFRSGEDFSIFGLAEQIVRWNLDDRIKAGDPEVVNEIANYAGASAFSFATKYCCYHNFHCYDKDDYSIFDGVVADTIPQYLDVTKQYIKQCRDKHGCNYEKYHNVIDRLIDVYGLGDIPQIRRKLDHFLWYPNKPKNQKTNTE